MSHPVDLSLHHDEHVGTLWAALKIRPNPNAYPPFVPFPSFLHSCNIWNMRKGYIGAGSNTENLECFDTLWPDIFTYCVPVPKCSCKRGHLYVIPSKVVSSNVIVQLEIQSIFLHCVLYNRELLYIGTVANIIVFILCPSEKVSSSPLSFLVFPFLFCYIDIC